MRSSLYAYAFPVRSVRAVKAVLLEDSLNTTVRVYMLGCEFALSGNLTVYYNKMYKEYKINMDTLLD